MLSFQKIRLEDSDKLQELICREDELSCESAFVNMLVWGGMYKNMAAVSDGQLIIKSENGGREVFRLPYGDDFEKGMALIMAYCGEKKPSFWVQEGQRAQYFMSAYAGQYEMHEHRDASDYVYTRQALCDLAGKKYHSKRNHISVFTRQFDWHYEPIGQSNLEKIKQCAEDWYHENPDRMDRYMKTEREGVSLILNNMDRLKALGGAIFVGQKAVAFTLGTAINGKIFDIHIEKALSEYQAAYTVINNQFAKNALDGYELINREDDMGLEGLRKAKLSYQPLMLLKKYSCIPK